jgi:hypothetical protein
MISDDVKLIIHWHMNVIKQKHIYPFINPIVKALLIRTDRVLIISS